MKLYKPFALLIFLLGSTQFVLSQVSEVPVKKSRHTAYAEWGTSPISSNLTINYEPMIFRTPDDRFQLNGRVGLGVGFNFSSYYSTNHGGLAGLSMLFGQGQNRFYMCGGKIMGWESSRFSGETRTKSPPLIELGWRYDNYAKGLMVKTTAGTLGLSIGVGFTF